MAFVDTACFGVFNLFPSGKNRTQREHNFLFYLELSLYSGLGEARQEPQALETKVSSL